MRVFHLTTEFPPLVYGGLGTAIGGLEAEHVAAVDRAMAGETDISG